MATNKLVSIFSIFAMVTVASAGDLKYGYYKDTCPNVEEISKRITSELVSKDATLGPALLRMDFHDCIVRGCDASVLLDPTPSNSATEKDALPNSTLRGFQVINAIKAALEAECPGVVSCADVLRLASRDAISEIDGPYWKVPLGRKDGTVSLKSEALAKIPSPFADIATLKQNFLDVGLTSKDLAILSGAHTIGITHCFLLKGRLYNFSGKNDMDPSMDPIYAAQLKVKCPPTSGGEIVDMDAYTPKNFDEKYYTTVSENKGLFQSDAALLNDADTRGYLVSQVNSGGASFPKDFAKSMIKLIEIGVLTGDQGEVRKTCGAVNSNY